MVFGLPASAANRVNMLNRDAPMNQLTTVMKRSPKFDRINVKMLTAMQSKIQSASRVMTLITSNTPGIAEPTITLVSSLRFGIRILHLGLLE